MAQWKYKLEADGKILRELINNADNSIDIIIDIYKQLIHCLEVWKDNLLPADKEEWEYFIDSMIDDLNCAYPDKNDETVLYGEEEEKLNYYLQDFFDLCDAARVWIGV